VFVACLTATQKDLILVTVESPYATSY